VIYGLILVLHVLVCFSLILVVLLQSGKGGGLSGAFGGMGGSGQALFGGRGAATFLSKATTVLGITFMTTSLVLALMGGGRGTQRSVLRQSPEPGTAPPPATSQPLELPGGASLLEVPVEGETEGAATPAQPGTETAPAPAGEGTDTEPDAGN
jgi:preprotein translocase subunit SecG